MEGAIWSQGYSSSVYLYIYIYYHIRIPYSITSQLELLRVFQPSARPTRVKCPSFSLLGCQAATHVTGDLERFFMGFTRGKNRQLEGFSNAVELLGCPGLMETTEICRRFRSHSCRYSQDVATQFSLHITHVF